MTKTTTKTTKAATKKVATKKAATPKNEMANLRDLRGENFSLKMKHALGELKEVHKLRTARRAIARHLTLLNNSK